MNSALKEESEKNSTLNSHQAQFVRAHSHCAICETELEIHHDINMTERVVEEEAYCGCCGIRARKSSYSLN